MHTVDIKASVYVDIDKISDVSNYNHSNYNHYAGSRLSYYKIFLSENNRIGLTSDYYYANYLPKQITSAFYLLAGDISINDMSINVTVPGVYNLEKLWKHSNRKFQYVFFDKPGTYSFIKIYKFLRTTGQKWIGKGLAIGEINNILSLPAKSKQPEVAAENVELAQIMLSEVRFILPYGFDSEEELSKSDVFNKIKDVVGSLGFIDKPKNNVVIAAVEDVAKPNNKYDEYFMLHNRYIPMVVTSYNLNIDRGFWLKSNGSLESVNDSVLPLKKKGGLLASLSYILRGSNCDKFFNYVNPSCQQSYIGWYDSILDFLAYDIETCSIIRSDAVSNAAHLFMRDNIDKYTKSVVELLPEQPSDTMVKSINEYLKARGFRKFEITSATPIKFRDSAQEQNWVKNTNRSNLGEWHNAYNISVSYNNILIIGRGSENQGHLIVKADADGNYIMIQSAWCQRTSKWTKQYAIDQKNSDWRIEDWLSGPFAEKIGLKIEEAPIVYFGNKSNKANQRREILKKMRAMQNS